MVCILNSDFVQKLRVELDKEVFPVGSGDDAYNIAKDIVDYCEVYGDECFDDMWAYVQGLLAYKLLTIRDIPTDNINYNRVDVYREYSICTTVN